MYRMNNGMMPHDRLDPRLLERLSVMPENESGCGCNHTPQRQARNMCDGEESQPRCACEEMNNDFNYTLAMVYSPTQEWQNLYCVEEGLMAGTIFKELDKPFYGPRCHGGNCNA